MEGKNSHAATITKHLSSQPVVQCPWTSKAPLNAVIGLKSNPNPNNSQTTNGQKCNFQNMHPTPEKEVILLIMFFNVNTIVTKQFF